MNECETRRNNIKSKEAAFAVSSVPGKKSDRDKGLPVFTKTCNDGLTRQKNESDFYLIHRKEENEFYVKRDYTLHDTTMDEDMEGFEGVCDNVLSKVNAAMVGSSPYEKKAIKELRDKLLGTKKGSLPEYAKIFLHVAKFVIPRFEYTRVVKLVTMSNGEVVLVCSCRFW